ncbi:MAG: hypothetical protein CMP35_00680 [Rickettsiales bacterium]|nr:hypothetical protein [Rickettsiales bacterium]|tara:strand:- start:386 stop:616 length:231 start_codon:yes stop_codon:yes gene_type:complete
MGNKYSTSKKDFLKNKIWILAWGGASQRANIFPSQMGENDRRVIREEIKKTVFIVFDQFEYLQRISEELLIKKYLI